MNNKQIKINLPRYTVLANKKVSTLKGDAHLRFIVAKYNDEYVSWLYNADFKSVYLGYYFKNMLDAMKHHASRN